MKMGDLLNGFSPCHLTPWNKGIQVQEMPTVRVKTGPNPHSAVSPDTPSVSAPSHEPHPDTVQLLNPPLKAPESAVVKIEVSIWIQMHGKDHRCVTKDHKSSPTSLWFENIGTSFGGPLSAESIRGLPCCCDHNIVHVDNPGSRFLFPAAWLYRSPYENVGAQI